jgi:hypothetical protein
VNIREAFDSWEAYYGKALKNHQDIVKEAVRLKDENERLREAGDAMRRFVKPHCTIESKMLVEDWDKAKEGVQS